MSEDAPLSSGLGAAQPAIPLSSDRRKGMIFRQPPMLACAPARFSRKSTSGVFSRSPSSIDDTGRKFVTEAEPVFRPDIRGPALAGDASDGNIENEAAARTDAIPGTGAARRF